MNHYIKFILNHRKLVIGFFLGAMLISYIMSLGVTTNFKLSEYLPDNAPSTKALHIMEKQFDKKSPNARVMIQSVSVPDALEFKKKLSAVDGVDDVIWLDDVVDVHQPIKFLPEKTVESYYKDENALFTVTVDESKNVEVVHKLREIIGEKGAMSGTVVDDVASIDGSSEETKNAMGLVMAIIIIVLILTTRSWFDPILFLAPIGIAVMLNEGTNIFRGQISYVTSSAAGILQIAISIDYAIFLLNRFNEMKAEGLAPREAMEEAIRKAFSAVLSSGLATGTGFAALILMRFKIGPDMGIVLAKAVFLSLVCVLVFLPAFTLEFHKLVERTHHRPFLPSFEKFTSLSMKVGIPALLILLILLAPCFLGQKNNNFIYGAGDPNPKTKVGQDTLLIDKTFDKSNLMVLMVPNNSPSKEKALGDELKEIDKVTSVVSYATSVGMPIPPKFVPENALSQLISKDYSRIIVTVEVDDESAEAFELVERIRDKSEEYFGDDYLLLGTTVNTLDMKNVVTADAERVDIASIGAIAIILLFSLKSLSLPVILIFIIQASVYVNMSVPYFMDQSLMYIGYLIISSVQLGASVDYAILFGERYIENREIMPKKEAAKKTVSDTAVSILTSAGILALAGSALAITSSNNSTIALGTLLGRGVTLSLLFVLFILPTILMLLDGFIQKTSYKLDFYKEVKENAL